MKRWNSTLEQRTPLKRKTRLKTKTKLKPVSKKQQAELRLRGKLKTELLEQNQVCMVCGNPPDFRGLSLHHLKHLSQGGKTTKENTVLCCYPCHSKFHGIQEK